MRFTLIAALAGVAVATGVGSGKNLSYVPISQIGDGQIQAPTGVPPPPPGPPGPPGPPSGPPPPPSGPPPPPSPPSNGTGPVSKTKTKSAAPATSAPASPPPPPQGPPPPAPKASGPAGPPPPAPKASGPAVQTGAAVANNAGAGLSFAAFVAAMLL